MVRVAVSACTALAVSATLGVALASAEGAPSPVALYAVTRTV